MNNIRNEMDALKMAQSRIYSEIRNLQNICPHNNVVRVAKANTGNYDPSADSYWLDCKCHDCDKIWTEDQ